jgi:hypothetical protein
MIAKALNGLRALINAEMKGKMEPRKQLIVCGFVIPKRTP